VGENRILGALDIELSAAAFNTACNRQVRTALQLTGFKEIPDSLNPILKPILNQQNSQF